MRSQRQFASIGALALLLVVGLTAGIGTTAVVADAAAPSDVDLDDAAPPDLVAIDEQFTVDATVIDDRDDVADVCWKFDDADACHDAETTHSFGEAGYHTATLIVTDADGERYSTTRPVVVTAPPSAVLNVPERAEAGAWVPLDAGESDDDAGIEHYEWDLDGDGTVDETTAIPTVPHAFETVGTHDVTVTVVDALGQEDTTTATIEVVESTSDDDVADDGDVRSAQESVDADELSGANTAEDGPGFGAAIAVLALLLAAVGSLYRLR